MAVTGTSVAAAATMLGVAAAIFISLVLCFYLFRFAKRYRGAAPALADVGGRAGLVFAGFPGSGGGGGMDPAAIAALPRKEVPPGRPAADCAVCIADLAAGEAARVLPRCGHEFHADCIDTWLASHSTCPLCRCAVLDDDAVRRGPPEADPHSPDFPTNVLFFGSRNAVTARGAPEPPRPPGQPLPVLTPPPQPAPGPIAGVAAVVEAARVAALRRLLRYGGGANPSPPQAPPTQPSPSAQQQQDCDLESGLAGDESSGSPPAKPQSGS